jgi:hypothetical protein
VRLPNYISITKNPSSSACFFDANLKGNVLISSQESCDVVSSNEALSATVELSPQHKMTVELPPNIKLRLDVETTDTNLSVSEDVGRLCESSAVEISGGDLVVIVRRGVLSMEGEWRSETRRYSDLMGCLNSPTNG